MARLLARRLDALHFSSDQIRREIFPTRSYSAQDSHRTYQVLCQRAAAALAAGNGVVLDATFMQAAQRQPLCALAQDARSQFCLVLVTCSPALAEERLAARTGDPSEADVNVYQLLAPQFEPIVEPHIEIDNSSGLAQLQKQIEENVLPCILINDC